MLNQSKYHSYHNMLAMTYEEGLNLLKDALSKTREFLQDSTHFLYIVHSYYAGWLDDTNKRRRLVDKLFASFEEETVSYACAPLHNLLDFINTERSSSFAFLRPSLIQIYEAYQSNNQAFEDLYDILHQIPTQWYDEYWGEAFDAILSQLNVSKGKSDFELSHPKEITELISSLSMILNKGYRMSGSTTYDPYAGTGTFLEPGLDTYSQESRDNIYALGRLRTLALGYAPEESEKYTLADATKDWAVNEDGVKSFDLIVSFPPLGLRVPVTNDMAINWPAKMISIEDYLLYKGSESLNYGGHLIGIFLNSVLFGEGATRKQREKLVREKRVKLVVQLPSNLLYNIGLSVCIVILSDKSCPNDEILFMDASTLFIKEKRRNVLLVKDVVDILNQRLSSNLNDGFDTSSIDKYTVSVPIADVIAKGCSLSPSRYLMAELETFFNVPEGFEALPLKDIVYISNGAPVSKHLIRVVRGRDLITEGPIEYHTFENLPYEELNGRVIALQEDAILVLKVGNLKPTLYKSIEGDPVALNSNVTGLIPHKGFDPYYIVSELRKQYVTEQVEHLSEGSIVPHLKNRDLLSIRVIVPIERRLQHETFLTSQRLENEQHLKSIKFEEYISRERGRLDAMMSIRRHRINPYISGLQNNVSMLLDELFANEILTPSSEISPNYSVQDALENMEENLVELKNLFDAFTVDVNVGIAESIDLVSFLKRYNYTRKMPDRQFTLEKYLFEKSEHYPNIVFNGANLTEALDEIIHNAEKHFFPNTPDCSVWLSLRLNGKSVQLLILNNGEPVPADFDEEKSFNSFYHRDENGTGQGLFRVRQLCDEFGATIVWENDPDSTMATGLCITFKTSID